MCIVIDINTLASVFNESCERHYDFAPVKRWIEEGRGVLVFGGTKYKEELAKTNRYLRLIRLMKDGGRAVKITDKAVDELEESVKEKTAGSTCDDQHIIALLGASKCSLLCTSDSRSFVFIKDRNLYPSYMPRVRIYTSARNSRKLLVNSRPSALLNIER